MTEPAATIERLEQRGRAHDARHRGRRLRWRVFGAGPALVLLHGGHGSWLHWARNIEPLAQHFRLWLPDMPGFGDSEEPACDASDPARLARVVDALADTLATLEPDAGPLGLVGFSFGALVAASWAAQRGGVGRLLLVGPAGHRGRWPRWVDLADWRVADPAERRAALMHNLRSFMLHDPGCADDTAFEIHRRACEATRFRSKELSLAGGLAQALDAAAVPVDLAWGDDDVTAVAAEVGPALCAGRPERRWHLVPGAGHWLAWERPEALHALVRSVFSGGGGR